jgi:hypothetical protein
VTLQRSVRSVEVHDSKTFLCLILMREGHAAPAELGSAGFAIAISGHAYSLRHRRF